MFDVLTQRAWSQDAARSRRRDLLTLTHEATAERIAEPTLPI
jgi:hypothetical protein